MAPVAGRLLTAVIVLLLLADAAGDAAGDTEDLQYRRHRRIRRRDAPPRTPTTPPVRPSRPVHPLPPPPPPQPNCNNTFAPEEGLTASDDVCSAPVPAPPVVPPPRAGRCPPCVCPTPKPQPRPQPPRPFPGWPVPRPVPVPRSGGSNTDAGIDSGYCVMALAPMTMTCGQFIEAGNDTEAPTPGTACCSGLAEFIRTSSAAAAAGRGDGLLQCLCPYVLGDVNKTLKKPIDPVKMMYLPVACGVTLPPQLLFVCFTGRPLP